MSVSARKLLNEPLVHFVGLALLLFAAQALWPGAGREEIVVDRVTTDFLIKQQSGLLLRPLTQQEENDVIESYIEDELLFREAKKKGFDSNARVRKLMIQNMRFFLASEIPEPSEEDLRTFYENEKALFERPPSLSLEHVFFADPENVPENTLAMLRGGAEPSKVGDADFRIGKRLSNATQRQLVQIFGPDNAQKILSVADEDWYGPMKTPLGAHFVRVAARNPVAIPPFEEARRWVETEWLRSKQREIIDTELAKVRDDYIITIQERASAQDD